MKRLAQWLALLMVVGTAVAACGDGDSTADCAPGFKRCDGDCVPNDDPEFGCASTSCHSCFVPNAVIECGPSGECEVASCNTNWGDCDASASGCETNLASDVDNCGQCGTSCEQQFSWANVEGYLCANHNCGIDQCAAGWADADGLKTNGCESEEGAGGAPGAGGASAAAGAGGAPDSGGAGGAPAAAGAGGASDSGGAGGAPATAGAGGA